MTTRFKILVLGGTDIFGGRICQRLSRAANLQVIVAGRSRSKIDACLAHLHRMNAAADVDVAGALDEARTDSLRTAERAKRLKAAQSFEAFIGPWRKRSPRADILEYYGNWPEPRLETYDRPFWGDYS